MYARAVRTPPRLRRRRRTQSSAYEQCAKGCSFPDGQLDCIKYLKLGEKKTIRIPITDNIGKGTLTGIIVGIIWLGIASGLLVISKQLIITRRTEVSMLWLWIISAFLNVTLPLGPMTPYTRCPSKRTLTPLRIRFDPTAKANLSTSIFMVNPPDHQYERRRADEGRHHADGHLLG